MSDDERRLPAVEYVKPELVCYGRVAGLTEGGELNAIPTEDAEYYLAS